MKDGSWERRSSATATAAEIRARILAETRLTASAGISYNKLLAKLASDSGKSHSITRDVAYLDLDPGRRTRLHRRYGEYLARTPAVDGLSAAIVAKHLARGDNPEAAADLYLKAAEAARRSYQTQLAIRYFLRALQLLRENDPRRLDAHESLEAAFLRLTTPDTDSATGATTAPARR